MAEEPLFKQLPDAIIHKWSHGIACAFRFRDIARSSGIDAAREYIIAELPHLREKQKLVAFESHLVDVVEHPEFEEIWIKFSSVEEHQ